MKFPTFLLERSQTLYENTVEINLTESGVHPATMADLVPEAERAAVLALPLGYGHTDGTPALRQAVAAFYPGATAAEVMVGHGTSEANLLAMLSVVAPGEHIIVITPNFMQLDGLARALGVAVTTVPLSASAGWQPDPDAVRAALRPQTRLVTLCDPNNPTGVALTAASRSSLVAVTEAAGVWLLVDEIYRGSEIDGPEAAAGASGTLPPTAWGLGERVIVTGGLSKSFGCPGLRLGWALAPAALVDEMHRRQDYTTIGTGTLAQELGRRALTEPLRSQLLTRGRAILAAGRETVAAWLAGHPTWSWVRPQASGMAFVGYGLDLDSQAFVDQLRLQQGVFVCAGDWFGIPRHIRIGFGVDPAHLTQGLQRLDGFCADHG